MILFCATFGKDSESTALGFLGFFFFQVAMLYFKGVHFFNEGAVTGRKHMERWFGTGTVQAPVRILGVVFRVRRFPSCRLRACSYERRIVCLNMLIKFPPLGTVVGGFFSL
jgi:hypothetical protein